MNWDKAASYLENYIVRASSDIGGHSRSYALADNPRDREFYADIIQRTRTLSETASMLAGAIRAGIKNN